MGMGLVKRNQRKSRLADRKQMPAQSGRGHRRTAAIASLARRLCANHVRVMVVCLERLERFELDVLKLDRLYGGLEQFPE